jgi:hypothetical protein
MSVLNSSDCSGLIAGGDVKIALCDSPDEKYISVQTKCLQINSEKPMIQGNNEVGMGSPGGTLTTEIDLMTLG